MKDDTATWYARAHYNVALSYHLRNRLEDARREYELALTIDPGYYEAYNNLGEIHFTQNRLDEALRLLQRALQADPTRSLAHVNLARIARAQHNTSEAMASLHRALVVNPNDADAYHMLGQMWYDEGQFERARTMFKRAVDLRPEHDEARLGQALAAMQMKDDDEALGLLQRIVERNPSHYAAYNNLGILHHRHARYAEAVTHFRVAMAIRPEALEPRKNLAVTYSAQGLHERAAETYHDALERCRNPEEAQRIKEILRRLEPVAR